MHMQRNTIVVLIMIGLVAATANAEQTILSAFAPAGSDGSTVVLQIDWLQVKEAAPNVDHVMLRRRPAGTPVQPDTVAFLPVDSARVTDVGLDPDLAYHYYAYFKKADSSMVRFGLYRAVVHLGPLHTRPGH